MKYHLINSAVMPKPGRYTLVQVDAAIFFQMVKNAASAGKLVSWIGYQQNAELIRAETGVVVRINRGKTEISTGDKLLCMTLSYRPDRKGGDVDPSDFEFYIADYNR